MIKIQPVDPNPGYNIGLIKGVFNPFPRSLLQPPIKKQLVRITGIPGLKPVIQTGYPT
jgi:hypothetical protein